MLIAIFFTILFVLLNVHVHRTSALIQTSPKVILSFNINEYIMRKKHRFSIRIGFSTRDLVGFIERISIKRSIYILSAHLSVRTFTLKVGYEDICGKLMYTFLHLLTVININPN